MSHRFFRWFTNLLLLLDVVLVLTACTAAPTSAPTPTQLPSTPTPQGRTLLVTSPADSGPGTLRQAMQDAQPYDTISFDPAIFPPDAPVTIFITSDLPPVSQGNLTIDASYAGVILDGRHATGDWLACLQIVESHANTIRGLQISNFSGPGIAISGDAQYNRIGGDRSIGAGPFGQGNLLSNNDYGINLSTPGTSLNTITGNLIGTDAEGAEASGNRVGVSIVEGANRNTIGPDNIIAYNGGPGIEVQHSEIVRNTLSQNSIHDNGGRGIDIPPINQLELQPPRNFNFDLRAGILTGTTCANCTVEIFSDSSDEGAIYEGKTIADDKGIFTFNKGSSFIGPHLTATATDLDDNTSGFSIPTSGTEGAVGSVILQQGNDLPKSIIQLKESRELADNRIWTWMSPLAGDIPNLDFLAKEIYAFGFKRLDTSLGETEPPIPWDFPENEIPPEFDRFIDVLNENGVAVNYIIVFWDKAGHPGGEGLTRPRFRTQEQVQDFLDYVRFIVSHYKGRVASYTIWVEPDACGPDTYDPYGTGGIKCILPQDYINVARQVIPVIRQEDPQAKVVTAPHVLFFAREDFITILRSDVISQFDVIAFKTAPEVTPDNEFFGNHYYEYPSIIQEIKQTASAHGFDGEYWDTDIGWDSKETCKPPDCIQVADHPWELLETDLQSAKYYARRIVMELGMDVGTGVGFLHPDAPWSTPTVRNLTTVMAGNKPLEIAVEIESDATNLMSFGFSLPNGDRLFALWTDGVAVDGDPGVPATLTFPGTSAQKVIGIDVLHGFEQELIIEMENGNLVIRNFLIKDYPIILHLIR